MWLEFIRFSLWGCFSAYFLGTAHISSLPITLWQNTLQRNMSLKRGERNGFFRSQIWRCEIRRTPFSLSLMEPTSASNGRRRSNKTEKNFDKNSHYSVVNSILHYNICDIFFILFSIHLSIVLEICGIPPLISFLILNLSSFKFLSNLDSICKRVWEYARISAYLLLKLCCHTTRNLIVHFNYIPLKEFCPCSFV